MQRVLAVDLGATSIRVIAVDLDRRPLRPRLLARRPHEAVRGADGILRWDWRAIVDFVIGGLQRGLDEGPVASIGIDTWGVDYGLLDGRGRLVGAPISYRDDRTRDWPAIAERLDPKRLFRRGGIAPAAVNTLFQLATHDRSELARARRILLLPELLVHTLTGSELGEPTSAGTTGLLDVESRTWASDLAEEVGVDPELLPPIVDAPQRVGTWHGVPVHLVAGHDTASAIAALPAGHETSAFVATGSWMIVGLERAGADTSDAAYEAGLSNEPTLDGSALLRNVPGLWLLEACRRQWRAASTAALLEAATEVEAAPFDVFDARFVAPVDMEAEVRAAAGLAATAPPAVVVRSILASIVEAVAGALDRLGEVTGETIDDVRVVGGGARNRLLLDLLGRRTARRVRTGPAEAAAIGNAMAQGVALGRYPDLAAARAHAHEPATGWG